MARKRVLKSLGLIALGVTLVANSLLPQMAYAMNDTSQTQEYVVMMKDEDSVISLLEEYDQQGVKSEEAEPLADAQACTLELTNKEANRLEKDQDVLFVEENIIFDAEENTDQEDVIDWEDINQDIEMEPYPDPGLVEDTEEILPVSANWNRDFIHANPEEIGNISGDGIRIAFLDSGLVHDSLYDCKERVDFVGNEIEDNLLLHEDLTGHGTGVNTVIAVNSPDSDIYSVRILDENNQAPLSKVIAGIQWAIDNHVNIINMSFGAIQPSEILHRKLREAYDKGMLLVAAAGNPRNTKDNGGMNNNFVADLKYMYRLARHYYDASSITQATATVSDVTIAKANYKILRDVVNKNTAFTVYNRSTKKSEKLKVNGDDVKGVIHMNIYNADAYPANKEKLTADDGTKEAAAWKILGLAVHMAGDTYAHRTRIPKSATEKGSGNVFDEDNAQMKGIYYTTTHSTNKKYTMAQFLKEENTYGTKTSAPEVVCCCKKCVIGAIQDGRMEFRDLPYVIKNADSSELLDFMSKYDDKIADKNGIHVYSQRYEQASNYAVNRMVAQFVADGDFSIHFFLPQKYSDAINGEAYTLKLNGLKYFIIQTGTQWDNLKKSTKDLVEKYSTGTETYF